MRACLLLCVLYTLTRGQPGYSPGPGCCQMKSVGSQQYQLLEEGATPSECHTPCIYSSLLPGDNKRYCFAPGDLTSVCMSASTTSTTTTATTPTTSTTARTSTGDPCLGIVPTESFIIGPDSLSSPNYPNDYPNGIYCALSHTLEAPVGQILEITFVAFELESCCDYVTVTDEDNTVLMRTNGNSIPPTLTSNTNRVEINFSTDGSVVRSGFHLTWRAIPDPGQQRKKEMRIQQEAQLEQQPKEGIKHGDDKKQKSDTKQD